MLIRLVFTAILLRVVIGECVSYGWDFVDGGQNYFINTLDPSPWSFGTIFYGKSSNTKIKIVLA